MRATEGCSYKDIEEKYPGISTRIWTVGAVLISISAFAVGVGTALTQARVPAMPAAHQEPWLAAIILMALTIPATVLFALVIGLDTYRLFEFLRGLEGSKQEGSQNADFWGLYITALFGGFAVAWGGVFILTQMLSSAFPGASVGVVRWFLLDSSRRLYFSVTVYAILLAVLIFKGRPGLVISGFMWALLGAFCIVLLLLWVEFLL